ncbi:hypothetical protein B0T25DRAFT_365063 [Lasiosphaeria hispida]|uniref:Uncharacterized protein n=1 Tax=Lasiosphaeria hispida TaxID=260671 RepID=A0AAJ0M7V3_9PEZI|nr:hypothetical protein B0T25DRAFT_365063 [Lasiosphaeria hispida]
MGLTLADTVHGALISISLSPIQGWAVAIVPALCRRNCNGWRGVWSAGRSLPGLRWCRSRSLSLGCDTLCQLSDFSPNRSGVSRMSLGQSSAKLPRREGCNQPRRGVRREREMGRQFSVPWVGNIAWGSPTQQRSPSSSALLGICDEHSSDMQTVGQDAPLEGKVPMKTNATATCAKSAQSHLMGFQERAPSMPQAQPPANTTASKHTHTTWTEREPADF